MSLLTVLIILSGISFLIYGTLTLVSLSMTDEFERFGLSGFRKLTGYLQIFGAVGLFVGLKYPFILLFSSGGLVFLMLLGFGIRIKIKDGILLSLPAFFSCF